MPPKANRAHVSPDESWAYIGASPPYLNVLIPNLLKHLSSTTPTFSRCSPALLSPISEVEALFIRLSATRSFGSTPHLAAQNWFFSSGFLTFRGEFVAI